MQLTESDIIEYFKTHQTTEDFLKTLIEESQRFDNSLSENEKHRLCLEDIQKIDKLYDTDKDFQILCEMLNKDIQYKIEKHKWFKEFAKKNSGYIYDTNEVPEEDIYIPWMELGEYTEGRNPFIFSETSETLYYLREDWDDLLVEDDCGGTEAFAAWWYGKFNTKYIPEFEINCDHQSIVTNSYTAETDNLFHIRRLVYNRTIWDFDSLTELYKEAIR